MSRHVQWRITLARTTHPVCTVPYVSRTKTFSHIMVQGGGICVTLTHSSLLLVNNYIHILPLVRLFAALIRPTHLS